MGKTRTPVKQARRTSERNGRDMAVILRGVPKGYNRGWFSREDPRMHLQTVDSKHHDLYKVWLEKKGKRVFEPAAEIPSTVHKRLRAEVTAKRRHVEGRWVNFMIANHWLSLSMKDSLITVTAYPSVPGSRFTRVVDLADYLQGIYNPRSQMWPKEPVKPEEVILSPELPAIEIWPQKEESLRYHILLSTILWQD
jgi:hypothetical protein